MEAPIITRPWGKFTVLLDSPFCKVKALQIDPGHRISYQYHKLRSELWTIVKGSATIILDDEKVFREKGESIKISQGAKHRVINDSTDTPLMIIEIQTGSYFGEEDIVRIEDDYGRPVDN